jgi:hypothetical protein
MALDEALAKGWTVVDMKRDWKAIYPFHRINERKKNGPALGHFRFW